MAASRDVKLRSLTISTVCYDETMAREEQDREDLMADATALVERAELQVDGLESTLIVGFRRNGAACIYVGAEPVFQFNASDELRRIFLEGDMIKAQGRRLVRMRRERTESETILHSRVLSPEEEGRLIDQTRTYLEQMRTRGFVILRQVPAEAELAKRITDWLEAFPNTIRVAERTNV